MGTVVFVINGNGGCGKDTFIEYCNKATQYSIRNVSTIEPIKLAALSLGWNGQKDEKNRKFLSDLKDLCTNAFDTSFNYIREEIENANDDDIAYIFVHSREPEEIERFKKEFNAITILIDASKRKQTIITNHADANVNNFKYDYYIENNGTLLEFENKAKEFIEYYDKEIENGTFD